MNLLFTAGTKKIYAAGKGADGKKIYCIEDAQGFWIYFSESELAVLVSQWKKRAVKSGGAR